jgi:acyl carrier protein
MEVNKRVIEILQDKLGIDEISSDDNLIEDIEADSLDIIELVMEMEREFGIQILDDEIDDNFTTVGHLIDFIQEKYEAL